MFGGVFVTNIIGIGSVFEFFVAGMFKLAVVKAGIFKTLVAVPPAVVVCPSIDVFTKHTVNTIVIICSFIKVSAFERPVGVSEVSDVIRSLAGVGSICCAGVLTLRPPGGDGVPCSRPAH